MTTLIPTDQLAAVLTAFLARITPDAGLRGPERRVKIPLDPHNSCARVTTVVSTSHRPKS